MSGGIGTPARGIFPAPHRTHGTGVARIVGHAIALLFMSPLGLGSIVTAALVASLYWVAMMVSPIVPGTAWADPEFVDGNPRPLGMAPPQLIGWVLLGLLGVAAALASTSR